MFTTEYEFEELPLVIGATEVSLFDGVACLEGDSGPHDRGFQCVAIELHGNAVGDYGDKRSVRIHDNCDDPFLKVLFHKLKDLIEADKSAEAHFCLDLEAYKFEAA